MNENMCLRRWMCGCYCVLLISITRFQDADYVVGVLGYDSSIMIRRLLPNTDINRRVKYFHHQRHQSQYINTIQILQSHSTQSQYVTLQNDHDHRRRSTTHQMTADDSSENIVATSSTNGSTAMKNENNNINNNNNNSNNNIDTYWNETQLMSYAYEEGIVVSISKVGPLIRTIARTRPITTSTSNDNHNNNNESSILLGYVEGFVRPTRAIPFLPSSSSPSLILHLDKMEVFNKQIQLARRNQPTLFRNGGTILGVGLLMGYLCVLDYVNNNCQNNNQHRLMTEFLAIDDEAFQHERLVKYYTTAGFQIIKYVGDDFGDIPDRLIWGGCGTLLRQHCIVLLQKWTKLMERSIAKRKKKTIERMTVEEKV